ncbi:hypothetical protein BaRGS_00001824, partial [Batillaria attramentaria]
YREWGLLNTEPLMTDSGNMNDPVSWLIALIKLAAVLTEKANAITGEAKSTVPFGHKPDAVIITFHKRCQAEVLQQILIWKLPNIQAIYSSFGEVRKTLLLILGCAVQCEHKESVIENIKRLDIDVQHAIVEHIKEITDDSEAVLAVEPTENLEAYTEKMFRHLTRLIRERDEQNEAVQELTQERDFYMAQAEGTAAPPPAPVSPDKHHQAVELAEIKAKLRHTRQELEDKLEMVSDLKDDLDYTQAELAKVKSDVSTRALDKYLTVY